jgi:hypothetical protein
VVSAIRAARDRRRGIVWGLGAHVVKTGLSPVLIDLMERGFVSASRPTAPASSTTSRSRSRAPPPRRWTRRSGPGEFGMAEETGTLLNAAINQTACLRGLGHRAGGRARLREMQPQHEP